MFEIERKFLVDSGDYRNAARSRTKITQGFLSTDPDRTIRVRRKGDKAWITIKGRSSDSGTTRAEWEYEIPPEDADRLLELCLGHLVRKIRYEVPEGDHLYEVDEFLDANSGLVVAEVELSDESEDFSRPGWLGREVTGEVDYYNAQLSTKPYKTWKNQD